MTTAKPEGRRRKTARCPVCKERFKISPRGPAANLLRSVLPSARLRATKMVEEVELLARNIASARVRDFVREPVRELLLEAGIILPPPPPLKPKPLHPPLRLVEK
jgi:hypothetical protein